MNIAHLFRSAVLIVVFAFVSAAQAQVTFNLTAGWNLLGNSGTAPIDVATTFGDSSKINTVWKWNKIANKWAFYAPSMSPADLATYASSKGYDVLTSIASKEGFWVNAATTTAISGPVAAGVTLTESDLAQGWNLVGSADSKTPAELNQSLSSSLATAGKGIVTTWAWDALTSKWKFYAPSLAAQGGTSLTDYISNKGYLPFTTAMSSTDGYWVNVGAVTPVVQGRDFSNITSLLSVAGTWLPMGPLSPAALAEEEHQLIKMPNGNYGLIMTGWAFNGWNPSDPVMKVSLVFLTPDAAGKESVNTTLISDPVTNGGKSVVIADFNGDGIPDVFLAAHTESPLTAQPSTAYMSNANGTYTKVTLTDSVAAHDAELGYINGKPFVYTEVYAGNRNPIYTYTNGQWTETIQNASEGLYIISELGFQPLSGCASTIGNFGPNGATALAVGDITHRSTDWKTFYDSRIYVYPINGSTNVVDYLHPAQIITPYLSTLPQYQNIASMNGIGQAHVSRIWTLDLNNDGKLDLLAAESMWADGLADYPSALQVMINKGDGTFRDMTAQLNPSMGFNTDEVDYSPTFMDIDHSGIDTLMFSSPGISGTAARQSNYVLINDGTGHLYVALHDQFAQLALQINAYLKAQGIYVSDGKSQKFMAVPQADSSINFVVEVSTNQWVGSGNSFWQSQYKLVNFSLAYNPTTDYIENITVSDRNQSMIMRTWAGNDIFYDTNANSQQTTIDGGLGSNTSVYSGVLANYTITRNADGTTSVVSKSSAPISVNDKLKNIQRLQFSDTSVSN